MTEANDSKNFKALTMYIAQYKECVYFLVVFPDKKIIHQLTCYLVVDGVII